MNLRDLEERAETYITDLIRSRRHSKLDLAARSFLFVLSRIYLFFVQWRITLYQQRIFRHRTLGCLVVSVGNITVGGTGKTPVVEVFSRSLARQGRRVAILSRGYRSKSKPLPQAVADLFEVLPDKLQPTFCQLQRID